MDEQEQAKVDDKITNDLNVVIDKMNLLDEMLKPGADSPAPSVKSHEALLAVIGFLEACAPRMVELVEAAAQGMLSGNVLEKCLAVNDRLLKQLQEIDTLALTESAASTTAASAPVKDMMDLLLDQNQHDDDDDSQQKQPTPAGTKSTGEEEEDDGKMPASDSKPSGDGVEGGDSAAADAAATDETNDADVPAGKDSFDDFFAERSAAFTKSDGTE